MSTLYHWESRQIQGRWVQAPQEWFLCVDCDKYGLDPYMLEGREITVMTRGVMAARRLGDYIPGPKKSQAYFRPWPDNVGDYVADEREQAMLRALRKAPAREIPKRVFVARCRLKMSAMRERQATAPIVQKSPGMTAWARWACERVDDTLQLMAAERDDMPPIPSQFQYVSAVEVMERLSGVISAAESKRNNGQGRPDFWTVSEPL